PRSLRAIPATRPAQLFHRDPGVLRAARTGRNARATRPPGESTRSRVNLRSGRWARPPRQPAWRHPAASAGRTAAAGRAPGRGRPPGPPELLGAANWLPSRSSWELVRPRLWAGGLDRYGARSFVPIAPAVSRIPRVPFPGAGGLLVADRCTGLPGTAVRRGVRGALARCAGRPRHRSPGGEVGYRG